MSIDEQLTVDSCNRAVGTDVSLDGLLVNSVQADSEAIWCRDKISALDRSPPNGRGFEPSMLGQID